MEVRVSGQPPRQERLPQALSPRVRDTRCRPGALQVRHHDLPHASSTCWTCSHLASSTGPVLPTHTTPHCCANAAPATPAAHPAEDRCRVPQPCTHPYHTRCHLSPPSLPQLTCHCRCRCRPGDTIWLAPGVTHTVRELQLRCTVHLLGGGAKPEDTVIVAAPGAESALDVR